MPPRQIEVTYRYTAKVLLPRKQVAVERPFVGRAWMVAHDVTADEAPLAFGPADPERHQDVAEHRWYDGRLWTRDRHPALTEDAGTHDFAWLAGGANSLEGLSHEEDKTVRHVVSHDRAAKEAKARENYDGQMVLDSELWIPATEQVLVVDTMGAGEYRVVIAPDGGGTPHMRYRLDQAGWMVEDWGEPMRMPNVAVHRPDLLAARTTEAYLVGSADDLLQSMARGLAHQGHAYFAAFHDLREAVKGFKATMAGGKDPDMEAVVTACRAAARVPADDVRNDGRSRDRAIHPKLLRRIERTLEAREPLPGFMP